MTTISAVTKLQTQRGILRGIRLLLSFEPGRTGEEGEEGVKNIEVMRGTLQINS